MWFVHFRRAFCFFSSRTLSLLVGSVSWRATVSCARLVRNHKIETTRQNHIEKAADRENWQTSININIIKHTQRFTRFESETFFFFAGSKSEIAKFQLLPSTLPWHLQLCLLGGVVFLYVVNRIEDAVLFETETERNCCCGRDTAVSFFCVCVFLFLRFFSTFSFFLQLTCASFNIFF